MSYILDIASKVSGAPEVERLGTVVDKLTTSSLKLNDALYGEAAALEKAAKARQDNSDTRWSPMARFISVAVAVAVIAGVVIAYASLRR